MVVDVIINNLKDMLLDRGDNIDEFSEHEVDIDREEFYNDKDVIEFHTSHTTIIFAITKILRKSITDKLKDAAKTDIMNFVSEYNDKKNIIIIFNNDTVSSPFTHQYHTYDKLLQKNDGCLQFFQMKHLLFNPTKHCLVPKHTKMTPEQTLQMMEKYLIKGKSQIPFILHNDVMAKWLGLRQGEVVEIERYNENSGLSYYYRVCV